jgi:Putative DNA-binding domain
MRLDPSAQPHSLGALQHWLQQAILQPLPAQHRAAEQAAAAHLQSTPSLPAHERLAIYQRAYQARLLQTFQHLLPSLHHAAGEESFGLFVHSYLRLHPPTQPQIDRAIDGFAGYLARSRPPRSEPHTPDWMDLYIDLAALDTALHHASLAPGHETASTTPAAASRPTATPDLHTLRPHRAACLQLLRCSHPVHHYAQALRQGSAPTLPTQPPSAPTYLAITRLHYHTSARELSAAQWQLLQHCNGQRTAAQALQQALRQLPPAQRHPAPSDEQLQLWLCNFMQQGLLRP